MKRLIMFLLVFSGVGLGSVAAQDWGALGTTWIYKELPSFGGVNYLEYKIVKDTILNALDCKKIEVNRHVFIVAPDGSEFFYNGAEKRRTAFLKEDNDKIFYYYLDEWRLLYDFNMQANESLEFVGPDSVSCAWPDVIPLNPMATYTVAELNQVVDINGIPYETLQINYGDANNWELGNEIVKAIGGRTSLFPSPTGIEDCGGYSASDRTESLTCFYIPSGASIQFYDLHITDTEICQNLITSTNELDHSISKNNITIAPNPVLGQDLFLTNLGKVNPTNFQIYRLDGALISEGKMSNDEQKINTGHLESGLYFLLLQIEDDFITLKFVKP